MKVSVVLLVATLVAGVAKAGFFAHPLPLLRTPRVYNIIVRSDGSLLPSAAYSLPLDHPIFHTAPGAAPSLGKASPAKDGDKEQTSAAAPAESGSDAPASPSSPAPPHLAPPPALPITHVAVNFPGAANSSSEPTVVATTLPFYSLYHPLAFPIPDPTPFIHPFGPHPGYFFAPAFHPPAIPAAAAPAAAPGDAKAAATPSKESDGGEKAKEEKEESER